MPGAPAIVLLAEGRHGALMPANMGKRSALPWFRAANASGQDFEGQRTGD